MKRSADVQEEIMTKGIHPDAIPQPTGYEHQYIDPNNPSQTHQPGLHGYG